MSPIDGNLCKSRFTLIDKFLHFPMENNGLLQINLLRIDREQPFGPDHQNPFSILVLVWNVLNQGIFKI